MTAEDLAWQALSDVLDEVTPRCDGIDAFTVDKPPPADQEFMASLCAACPVLPECSAYVAAAKPAAGFWAGRQFGVKKKPTKTTDAEAVSPATITE